MPVQGKGKGKVVSVNARMAYRWKRGTVPLIPNFGAAWECGQLHALAALSPEKTQCPLNSRRLGELRNQSGRSGDKKNFLFLPGFDLQIIQPVTSRYINYSTPVPGMPFPEKCSSSSSCYCKYRCGCCCCCCKCRCRSCKCPRRRCFRCCC